MSNLECTRIDCHKEATVTLDLTIPLGNTDETFDQEIPYCDNDIGWFFRSFSRKSYHVTVRGITVIKDLDDEFDFLRRNHEDV